MYEDRRNNDRKRYSDHNRDRNFSDQPRERNYIPHERRPRSPRFIETPTEPPCAPVLNTRHVKVLPLALRKSLARLEDIIIPASGTPKPLPAEMEDKLQSCVESIIRARKKGAAVILMYGAHLIKNGGARLLINLMERGWITHLATNGAGCIHDWEFAFGGVSTESVKENVATGTFGAWRETGNNIHLALLAGGIHGRGFGESIGKWVMEDGGFIPTQEMLMQQICASPTDPETAARADLLQIVNAGLPIGKRRVTHKFKQISVAGNAWKLGIPFTVHPGIGYDIFTVHPLFNGSVIGRAGGIDFQRFCLSVENLTDGVVLSIGSAIMAPQVFEKSLSIVHNLRFQQKRPPITGHTFTIVDLQEGGNWDWSKGEPDKSNPAYYLRFCKSFSRMGGVMQYLQCDNTTFLHNISSRLQGNEDQIAPKTVEEPEQTESAETPMTDADPRP